MINKDKIKRGNSYRTKLISMRIPISACKFMKENNYSPTAIMIEALKELGWKRRVPFKGLVSKTLMLIYSV